MDLWQTLFSLEDTKQLYYLRKPELKLAILQNKYFYRLEINDVIQSAFANSAPYRPALPHCAVMLLPLLHDTKPNSVLELGGGGQAMQRYFSFAYPQIKFTSVENNRDVFEATKQLPAFERLNIELGDAFAYVEECITLKKSYSWVMVDLFNGKTSPQQAQQSLFYQQLLSILKPGGWLIVNCLSNKPEDLKNLYELMAKHNPSKIKAFAVPGQINHIFMCKKKRFTNEPDFVFEDEIEAHNLF